MKIWVSLCPHLCDYTSRCSPMSILSQYHWASEGRFGGSGVIEWDRVINWSPVKMSSHQWQPVSLVTCCMSVRNVGRGKVISWEGTAIMITYMINQWHHYWKLTYEATVQYYTSQKWHNVQLQPNVTTKVIMSYPYHTITYIILLKLRW